MPRKKRAELAGSYTSKKIKRKPVYKGVRKATARVLYNGDKARYLTSGLWAKYGTQVRRSARLRR